MKKFVTIIICISMLLFVSCTNTNKTAEYNDNYKKMSSNLDSINSTKSDSEKTKKESKYPNVEKLVFTYIDGNFDIKDNIIIEQYIDGIKECNTVPETELVLEVGTITIRYNDGTKDKTLAKLYFGDDQNIYAKYIENTNKKYAYLIEK